MSLRRRLRTAPTGLPGGALAPRTRLIGFYARSFSMPISDTARSILTEASQHPLGVATPPATLLAAARHTVLRSLLRQGLVTERSVPADQPGPSWRQADGTTTTTQITEVGRRALGCGDPQDLVDKLDIDCQATAKHDVGQKAALHTLSAGINSLADDEDGPVAAAGSVPANALTEPHSESLAPPTTSPVGDCGEGDKGAGGPSRTPRQAPCQFRLREAAQAVLAAWGYARAAWVGRCHRRAASGPGREPPDPQRRSSPASLARIPSRRRSWPCCAAPRAPPGRR